MSEFEKELEKNMQLGKVTNERESIYSDFLVSKRDIERIFYDWQLPKPLVEVPQCVDNAIKALPKYYSVYSAINYIRDKVNEDEHWLDVYEWIFRESNVNEFARALLDDYTVKKEKLFYLKHIDFCKTDKHYDWFTIKHSDGPLNHLRVEKGQKPSTIDCKFTQQEIDKLNIGSYEQIEVKV